MCGLLGGRERERGEMQKVRHVEVQVKALEAESQLIVLTFVILMALKLHLKGSCDG